MRRAALPLLVALVLAVPARADAPSGQYESFAKDFPFILDVNTHLRWQRFVDPQIKLQSIPPAQNYCGGLALGSGYRLPTVKELLTLVDEEPHSEFEQGASTQRYIDRNAFAGTPTDLRYLTLNDDGGNPWLVDFGTGTAEHQKGSAGTFYIRCVRAEKP